jgi:hypothetical protein
MGSLHAAQAHQTIHKNMKKKEEDEAAGSCMEEGRLVLSYTVIFEIGFTPEHSHFMF